MKQITQWVDPAGHIDSQYGEISYQEWCEREVKRISPKCMIKESHGKIAIFKAC